MYIFGFKVFGSVERESWISVYIANEVCVVECVCRQLNLLSTATPAVGAWLVPIDQLKSSLQKLDMEATLRVCAVMGCIMTEALEVRLVNTYTIRHPWICSLIQQNCGPNLTGLILWALVFVL